MLRSIHYVLSLFEFACTLYTKLIYERLLINLKNQKNGKFTFIFIYVLKLLYLHIFLSFFLFFLDFVCRYFIDDIDYFTVPVTANITIGQNQFPEGSDVNIACHVDGYPIARVSWYKDNEIIHPNNRIQITGKHNK